MTSPESGACDGRRANAVSAGATLLKGGAAMLARYMDDSRSIPTATSFRTLTVTVLEARRKQLKAAGLKVSFTHLIAYAIAKAGAAMPVMAHHFAEVDGKPHRVEDGAVNLGLAVDVEKKDGSRTLMVPVIRGADALDFKGFLAAYDALVEKARTNTLTADDLTGGNVTLTNPGGIGTVASVPRLMVGQGTIVATGSIAYPVGLGAIGAQIGAEKAMSMTSTYDHRIIQGAESGRFLQLIERYLQGEDAFYEDVFQALGVELPELPPPPAPAAAAAATAPPAPATAAPSEELLQAVQAAVSLIKAYRTHGHLAARLDPLGSEPVGDPALDTEPLRLTPELMAQIPARILRIGVPGATFADALPHLRDTYCGTIAYEIEHISSHRQRVWLREKIETGAFRQPLTSEERKALLKRLTEVDALERFMHKAYLGQKQFSIEGLDMTVPMVDELIRLAGANGGREVVLGMAHRGRLNVLAHNLGRSYGSIFAEFEGVSTLDVITSIPQGGTGDVKYHHGARGTHELPDGSSLIVRLESNPSHLEYVAPVATGATRAAQTTRQGPHATQDTNAAFPIVLHGDAAFPGQGVVAETFNLQALDGYTVGGSIHLIQNNQVGFTTDPDDARSTRWASDLAKGFDVPIIHVNADDVAACISAVRLGHAYRQEFGHDVLIDLIGYRRFGHNEADEPAYTQPEMYARIRDHPTTPTLYARQLIDAGVVTQNEADAMTDAVWQELSEQHQQLKARLSAATAVEQGTGEYQLDRTPSPDVATAVEAERLRELNDALLRVPDGFTVHPKLKRPLEQRREAMGPDGGITWAHAELLAFASLLTEGTPVRLTGQDAERGTFSQRHTRAARPQDRAGVLPDPAPAERDRADGAAQQPAVGDGGARLRVRLLAGGSRDARAVGGAVRRLRQQRAGDHRPVHRLRPREVGPVDAPDAAAAARLRGLRPGALLRAPGALAAARRRGQHPRRLPLDPGAVLPPAAAPGEDRQAAAAGRDDAEVAAAPAAGDEPHRAPLGHAVLPRAGGAARRQREGLAPDPLQRQGLLRPRRRRAAPGQRRRRDRPRRAALSVPAVRRSSSSSAATRTSEKSSGCRRSRATWAPARTCLRASCRSSRAS